MLTWAVLRNLFQNPYALVAHEGFFFLVLPGARDGSCATAESTRCLMEFCSLN